MIPGCRGTPSEGSRRGIQGPLSSGGFSFIALVSVPFSLIRAAVAAVGSLRRRVQYRNFAGRSAEDVFTEHYHANHWDSEESVSGRGSSMSRTEGVRKALPGIVERYEVDTLLDLPCGDFHWMQHVELDADYIGADIVDDLVQANEERYGSERCRFVRHDLLAEPPPPADLVLCRDVFVHFSFEDIATAIEHIRTSGATYLLTTTFTERSFNTDTPTGGWRTVNLQLAPFHFPEPLELVDERRPQDGSPYKDKHLGLWRVADLPAVAV